MRFSELYANLIKEWPEEILISDAHLPSKTGGQYFPTLTRINDEIEDKIDFKNDNWSSVVQWAFFQAFHAEAKKLYSQGEIVLKTRAVPLESINTRIAKNLKGEGWENERASYDPS
ncbi:MAG: hypothetical protein WAO71_04360 [Gallionella sp.]